MTTADATGERARARLPVRKPQFAFDASIPKHWLAGNAAATHFFNGLNLLFPEGERFFVKAVRDALPRVRDPELRELAKGFFGQEAWHAREHERYFATLEAQGYRIDGFLRRFRAFVRTCERWFPLGLRLAVTAGVEHWTATLAALVLERDNPLLDEMHPTMRALVVWHATEEIEHKAVAFDVLAEVAPGYALRVAGFLIATAVVGGWALAGARMLLRQDGFRAREIRAMREAIAERTGRRLERRVAQAFRAYLRRDFHPSETDELALAHERLAEVGLAGLEAGASA